MRLLLLLVAGCCLFISCRKNRNNNLVGKWKLVAVFNVSQDWRDVIADQQQVLTINADKTYSVKPPLISSFSGCSGNYSNGSGNMLVMNLACLPDPTYKDMLVYTVDGNTLILDHVATSAGIKTKYTRQ